MPLEPTLSELGRLAVEAHGERVDLLDGVGVPQPRGLLRIALVVLVARLELLEQKALHQADHRRAGLGVERVLEVPDHIVGVELPAVVPFHGPPHLEGPRLEVGARLPLLHEAGAGDVVDAGDRQVVEDLPRRVRRFHPAVGVRGSQILAAHTEAQGAAAREVLRGRRRHQRLAGNAAGERIGGGGRHSEKGRVAEKLAAVDLPLDELTLQGGDEGVLADLAHRRHLQSPQGGDSVGAARGVVNRASGRSVPAQTSRGRSPSTMIRHSTRFWLRS